MRLFIKLVKHALAGKCLTAALWTPLHVATGNVILPLHNCAVVAGILVGAPVFGFVTIFDPWIALAFDNVVCLRLSRIDYCLP